MHTRVQSCQEHIHHNSRSFIKTLVLTSVAALLASHGHAQDSGYQGSDCVANSSWFQTPVAPPKEGANSPFAFKTVDGKLTDPSTNCDFHQWSWNKFLYLTQKDKNGDLVMFGPDYHQVDNKLQPYISPTAYYLPLSNAVFEKQLILEDSTQAGFDNPVLYTKYAEAGYDNTPIHYSIHINNIFAASVAKTFSAEKPSEFDVGSVELKAAWAKVDDLQKIYPDKDIRQQYYVRNAIFMDDKKLLSSSDVALIGLHVVGVVENHPEFIWATFEHNATAPDYYKSNSQGQFSRSEQYVEPDTVVSDSDAYMIYKGETPVKDVQFDFNQVKDNTFTNMFRLYQYGVPNGYPYTDTTNATYGADQDQQDRDKTNFDNIASLNQSVSDSLKSSNPVWNNYFYAGSIWLSTLDYNFNDGISGDIVGSKANSSLRGSLAAANMTMETYTQTFSNVSGANPNIKPANCFACHSISAGQSVMKVSHIYDNYVDLLNQMKATQ